jgi:dihydrodipicolinate synthase/N-acetylneuraminate lyase
VNNFDPLWAPILTHYELGDNLRLNKALIKKHMKWLEPSVKQFLVCGTTGDGWILSDKLINDWLEILTEKNFLTDQNKILFGAFGNTTKEVLHRAKLIEDYLTNHTCEASFFGLTLCAPVNKKITQNEIIKHFEKIIENTLLPISIYQLPQVVKCEIKPETLKYLKDKFKKRIVLFKDTSDEDKVIDSKIDFGDLKFLRGAEKNYFNHIKPRGKYDGFLLSTANCFGKVLREILKEVEENNFEKAENLSKKLSDIIRVSFDKGEKLNFGNPFSNVNKAFLHIIFNKEKFNDLNCKTCFKNNIPVDFLTYANGLLVENKLINSLK